MKIPVVWLDGQRGYWDHTLLLKAFDGELSNVPNQYEYEHYDSPYGGVLGCVLVVCGGGGEGKEKQVQDLIKVMRWVLVIVVSDECNLFKWQDLKLHDRAKIWVQTPDLKSEQKPDRYLPVGLTPHTRNLHYDKSRGWFFAGQKNTPERVAVIGALEKREFVADDGLLISTGGFSQGYEAHEYNEVMNGAKFIPCPRGVVSPDSFRLCESLEVGAVPIATSDIVDGKNFYEAIFGEPVPFPVFEDLALNVDSFIDDNKDNFKALSNKCRSWWGLQKRKLLTDLTDTVSELSGTEPPKQETDLTILIPTSPIESHPSSYHIDCVLDSIRLHPHLKNCEIIIMVDGIRDELKQYTEAYETYVASLLRRSENIDNNLTVITFDVHTHQAGMTREALMLVRTENILFVEHDTFLVHTHTYSDIRGICNAITHRWDCNMVRLHYDVSIHPEHLHLMLDTEPQMVEGVPMIRSQQWSQRPHIASTAFYKAMLEEHFAPDALTMLEDRNHGLLQSAHANGEWDQWGHWIYAEGFPDKMKYSGHSDARKSDSKFEDQFRW